MSPHLTNMKVHNKCIHVAEIQTALGDSNACGKDPYSLRHETNTLTTHLKRIMPIPFVKY